MQQFIGGNLSGVVDWSTQFPFIDHFKMSRQWLGQDNLALDALGWVTELQPGQVAKTYLTSLKHSIYKKFVVLYEGEGELDYFGGSVESSSPGRDVIDLSNLHSNFAITIEDTNPNNYIRNIRFIPLEFENTDQIFNPEFLEKTSSYNLLRFMDWMNTNNSDQEEWINRPQVLDLHYTPQEGVTGYGDGVPIEVMVSLSNTLDKTPWFNIPHKATDEYVREFASLVKDQLNDNLSIYVELSNEVWNGQFEQAHYARQQGLLAGYDNNPVSAGVDWFSKRTVDVIKIWEEVFGDQADRVIGVLGAQAANPWIASRALEFNWSDNPLTNEEAGIDAVAIAPYFGGYLGSSQYQHIVEDWSLDELFDELTEGGLISEQSALERSFDWMRNYNQLTNSEGLELIAYESGQHLVGHGGVENNQDITDLFIAANNDPRMGELYKEYYSQWFQLGGDDITAFNDITRNSKWGSWGLLSNVYQDSSPKWDAIQSFNHSLSSSNDDIVEDIVEPFLNPSDQSSLHNDQSSFNNDESTLPITMNDLINNEELILIPEEDELSNVIPELDIDDLTLGDILDNQNLEDLFSPIISPIELSDIIDEDDLIDHFCG